MNEYGTMARDHWRDHLPARYAQIEDAESWFAALGEDVAADIAGLWAEMMADAGNPPCEDYLDRVGRLNALKKQAEEVILAERVLLPPEGAEDDG